MIGYLKSYDVLRRYGVITAANTDAIIHAEVFDKAAIAPVMEMNLDFDFETSFKPDERTGRRTVIVSSVRMPQ